MKSITLLILLLLPIKHFCQSLQPEVYLFTKDESTSMAKFVNNEALSKNDSLACSKLVDYPDKINFEMSNKAKYNITGLNNDYLIIVFRDMATKKIVPISEGKLNSIIISNESNKTIYSKPIPEPGGNYLRISLMEISEFSPGYSVNKIGIRYNGSPEPKEYYFRYLSRFSSYGNIIKHSPVGFWFPVGQFGTDFKKTSEGIIFNAIPIGVALGTKVNFSSNFYIGASYSFDYTITKSNESDKTYSFSSFSHGPILDFGDYIHIGYNWFANLTNDGSNDRQPFFVIGIGVKTLDILKNRKSK